MKKYFFIVTFVVLSFTLFAQEESKVYNLSDLIKQALQVNSDILSAQATLQSTQSHDQASIWMFTPSLNLSATYLRLSPVDAGSLEVPLPTGKTQTVTFDAPLENSTTMKLSLQQPLFVGGKNYYNAEIARENVALAQSNLSLQQRNTAADLEKAYWNLVLAIETQKAVEESKLAIDAKLKDANVLFTQGATTKTLLLQWQMQAQSAAANLSTSNYEVQIARNRLNLILGRAWDSTLEIEIPDYPNVDKEINFEDKTNSLEELTIASTQLRIKESAVKQSRAGLWPSVFLIGDLSLSNPNNRVFPQKDEFSWSWDIGVMASLDIGRIPLVYFESESVNAQRDASAQQLTKTRNALSFRLAEAKINLAKAHDRYLTSNALVELASENVRVLDAQYQEGRAIPSALIDAQASLLNANLEHTRARIAWELARAALRDASGSSVIDELNK